MEGCIALMKDIFNEIAPFVCTHTETNMTGSMMTLAYKAKHRKEHVNADKNTTFRHGCSE